MTSSTACGTTPCRFPHPRRALPSGRSSARRSMVSGRRPMRICRQSFRACSRSSATCPGRRWRWLPASAARCCCSCSPSSLPGSSWPSARREPEARRSIFDRIVGIGRGEEFAKLSTATIRAVAQGVIGVAFIQAIVVGLVLMIAGVPFAGVLALIVLVLGIAQVPALLVTLPVIVYIWSSGDYGTVAAVTYTRAAVPRRHARQRAETADAGSRGRCAHARDLAGRVGRPGEHRHPGDVRRRDLAGPGLSDLHEVGGRPTRTLLRY